MKWIEAQPNLQIRSRTTLRSRYFSLTELLIVIAIFTILLLLLFPQLRRMSGEVRTLQCLNNQKSLSAVFGLYNGDFGIIPREAQFRSPTNMNYRYWPSFFHLNLTGNNKSYAGGDYLKDESTMHCVNNVNSEGGSSVGYYGMYYSTSNMLNFMTLDSEFYDYFVQGKNVDPDYLAFSSFKDNMPNASETMILGCTSMSGLPTRFGQGWVQFHPRQFWTGGSADQQGLWLNHLERTAALFGDGHAEAAGPLRLLDLRNNTDKNDGPNQGIHVWWSETGTAVTIPFQ